MEVASNDAEPNLDESSAGGEQPRTDEVVIPRASVAAARKGIIPDDSAEAPVHPRPLPRPLPSRREACASREEVAKNFQTPPRKVMFEKTRRRFSKEKSPAPEEKSPEPVDAEAEHTFKLLDLDGNGYLDTDELEVVLKEIAAAGEYAGTGAAMAWGKAAADGAKLFEEIDSNKDGQLSHDEWVEYFNFHVRQVGRETTVQLLWQLDDAAKLLKGRVERTVLLGPLVPPPSLLVHEELLAAAARHPSRTALVEEVRSPPSPVLYQLTFSEVVRRSSQVAEWLTCILRCGGGARTPHPDLAGRHLIAILMRKCPESMLAYYGVLMAGAVYVILDVNLKPAQLQEQLRDLPVSAILSAAGEQQAKLRAAAACVKVELAEKTQLDDCSINTDNHSTSCGGASPIPTLLCACDATVSERDAWWDTQSTVPGDVRPAATTPLHDDLPDLDTLACLAMTSGSTGQPKRILAAHRMISNENWARQIALPYVGDDECLQLKRRLASQGTYFGPDDAEYLEWLQSDEASEVEERYAMALIFHWDVPRALGRGVPAYIVPEAYLTDANLLVDFLERHRITRMFFSPSLLRSMLSNSSALIGHRSPSHTQGTSPSPLRHLRVVELGLEVTSLSLCESVSAALPNVFLCNEHGSNECGDTTLYIFKATNEVRRCTGTGSVAVPIGVPEGNMAMLVCDTESFAVVPWGVAGEICVYGLAMSDGYALAEDATALNSSAFLSLCGDAYDSSLAADGLPPQQRHGLAHVRSLLSQWTAGCNDWGPDCARCSDFAALRFKLYRMGDLGVVNADGQLCVLGRMDARVKIRGHNVHLGGVEAGLMKHLSIREALVMPWANPSTLLVDFLIAYYVRSDLEDDELVDLGAITPEGEVLPVAPALDAAELRQFLLKDLKMPAEAVPGKFVCLSAMPRNQVSQKYDRKALPSLEAFDRWASGKDLPSGSLAKVKRLKLAGYYNKHSTTVLAGGLCEEEEITVAAFARVLSVPRQWLDTESNFFESGGNSLQAMQLARAIQDDFIDLVKSSATEDSGDGRGTQGTVRRRITQRLSPEMSQAARDTLISDIVDAVQHVPVLSIFKKPTPAELSHVFCVTIFELLDVQKDDLLDGLPNHRPTLTPGLLHVPVTSPGMQCVNESATEPAEIDLLEIKVKAMPVPPTGDLPSSTSSVLGESVALQLAHLLLVACCEYMRLVPIFLVLGLWLFACASDYPANWVGVLACSLLWPYLFHTSLLLFCVLQKWLFVGRLGAGHGYWCYFRWRVGRQIHRIAKPSLLYLTGCPAALPLVLRALGADVDLSCQIETANVYDWDLLSIKHTAVLSRGVSVAAAKLGVGGSFALAPVRIRGAVGPRAHAYPSSTAKTTGLEEQALTTAIFEGETTGIASTYPGSCAAKFAGWLFATLLLNVCTTLALTAGLLPCLLCFLAWTPVVSLDGPSAAWALVEATFNLPAVHLGTLTALFVWGYFALSSYAMVLLTTLVYRACRLVCGLLLRLSCRPAVASAWDEACSTLFFERYLRLSMEGPLFRAALPAFHLTNTTSSFLRPLGMRLGRGTFINTPELDCPDLIHVGDGCVFGGDCMLLARPLALSRQRSGQSQGDTRDTTRNEGVSIRDDCLLANGCVVLSGATVGPNVWCGNRSLVNDNNRFTGLNDGRLVFQGSPARFLMKQSLAPCRANDPEDARTVAARFSPNQEETAADQPGKATINDQGWSEGGGFDSRVRACGWLAWHFYSAVLHAYTVPLFSAVWLGWQQSWYFLIADLAGTWLVGTLGTAALLLLHKRLIARRLKPGDTCTFGRWNFLRDELTKILLIHTGDDALSSLKGTRLFTLFLRWAGGDVDKSVVWLGNMPPEPDLLRVGPGTVVGPGVDVFTHNMEGWRYVYEPVSLGTGCALGERSSLMGYGEMQDGSQLEPLAQVMKGTLCRTGLVYEGNPADARRDRVGGRCLVDYSEIV